MYEKVIDIEESLILVVLLFLTQIITLFFSYYYLSFLMTLPKIGNFVNIGIVDINEHRDIKFFRNINIKQLIFLISLSITSCIGGIIFSQVNLFLFLLSNVIFLTSLIVITSWIAFKVLNYRETTGRR